MRTKYSLSGTSFISHLLSCFISSWSSPFHHLFLSSFLPLSLQFCFPLSCLRFYSVLCFSPCLLLVAHWLFCTVRVQQNFFPPLLLTIITFVKHSRWFNHGLKPLLHFRQIYMAYSNNISWEVFCLEIQKGKKRRRKNKIKVSHLNKSSPQCNLVSVWCRSFRGRSAAQLGVSVCK